MPQYMDVFLQHSYLLNLGVFLPVISIIIRRKPLWSQSSTKLFSAYIILDVIAWFLSFFLSSRGISTFIVSNCFTVGEILLLNLFFIQIFNLKNKKLFNWLTILLTIAFAISVFLSSNEQFNNYTDVFENLLFISLSLLFYYKIMREQKIENLLAYPHFYLVTGVLIYFSCSIFIVIFSNYFLDLTVMSQMYLWTFHSVINLICYVIFAIGLLKCKLRAKY
jgi:hypothetical protein